MKNVLVILAGSLLATTVKAQMPSPVDSLKISKDVSLDEVVITATKVGKETPVAYSDISKQELSSRNNGQGIPFLISQSPSVIMTSDAGTGIGYSGFRIRGTDANRINITINGVPVNDSESHTVFWANMADIASSVESIQIQRGAGTSTNGAAAFGATVAMQTEKPSLKPYGEYSVSAGSFGTLKHTVKGGTGLLYDHFAFDVRYSNIRSDGFIDRASARMSSYYASAAFYADNTLIKFQAFGNSEKTYQAWNGVPSYLLDTDRSYNPCGEYEEDGVKKFYNNQTDNYWQHNYHLMASQRIGDFWNMNLTLHYTDGNGYYEDYKSKAKFSSYKLPEYIDPEGNTVKKTDLVRRKWLDNYFYGAVYSANYQHDNTRLTLGTAVNNYVGDHFGRVMWTKSANVLPQPDYEYYRNTGKKLDYNVYAKLTQRLSPLFTGYLDLQYRGIHYTIKGNDDKAEEELDIHKNWNFFNPKAGLSWQIDRNHRLYGSFSVAHKEPTRNNYTDGYFTEHPKAERLFDYELGYTFANSWLHAGANFYYMDYKDQLVLTGELNEIGEAMASNVPDSYRTGIELMAGIKLDCGLQWDINATLSKNRVQNFTETLFENEEAGSEAWVIKHGDTPIAFSPDFILNNRFGYTFKGFEASLQSQYISKQYMSNAKQEECTLDAYFVSNLNLSYTFKLPKVKSVTVGCTIYNLFNEEYENNGYAGSGYYHDDNGGKVRYNYAGYAAQAGTNVLGHIAINF